MEAQAALESAETEGAQALMISIIITITIIHIIMTTTMGIIYLIIIIDIIIYSPSAGSRGGRAGGQRPRSYIIYMHERYIMYI